MRLIRVERAKRENAPCVSLVIINPQCMRHRVTVVVLSVCVCVCVSVCLSVTTKSAAYLFIHRNQGVMGFFTVFSRFCRVGFAENASFKSYGVIFWSLPPSSLPNDILMDKRDSNNFFSTREVCMYSDSSQNTTASSLTRAN